MRYAVIMLSMLAFTTASMCLDSSATASQKQAFGIRGIKGCYWDGIEKYRLALPWLAEHKLNFLMLCPSAFPASGTDWRSDYTDLEKQQVTDLAADGRKLGVDVCLAINPGLWSNPPLKYSSEEDYRIMLDKVKTFNARGIDWFALCLDDISTNMNPDDKAKFGTIQDAHVYLVNRLWNDMKPLKVKLIFCPSAYCDGHYAGLPEYTRAIGEKIDKDVMLFWTGPQVCSPSITAADARNAAKLLGRKPFIWDNYPVNDAFNWGPYMSPLKNRSADLAGECAGYIANEMKQWHMSTIALDTTAQYLVDPANYDPDKAIDKVIKSYPADQQRAIRLLVQLYGNSFWGEPNFPPYPRPTDADDASKMLPKYRVLRKELSQHPALIHVWDEVRPMLDQHIEVLGRMSNRPFDSPLKACGVDFAGGGGEVFGYKNYGRIVNYVYAKPSGKSEMSVPFFLKETPNAGATLRIAARGDGDPRKINIEISLNDLVLLSGPSPFRYDDFESRDFNVPAEHLRIGANLLTIRNLENEGWIGHRPHFIVSEAELSPRDNK